MFAPFFVVFYTINYNLPKHLNMTSEIFFQTNLIKLKILICCLLPSKRLF